MAVDMRVTPEQQEAISEIDHHLQIIACAGSGKTEVINRGLQIFCIISPASSLKTLWPSRLPRRRQNP